MTPETDTLTDFGAMLASLARGRAEDFLHLLTAYAEPVQIADTRATLRTHFVTADANGAPAIELLSQAVAAAALDFSIPRSRIEKANQVYEETKSADQLMRLSQQARELFIDLNGTGEGGELLLFLLMERVLKLPQLIAKMSLKTNSNMHVHGSDGVHGRLDQDGILDLFWGESKLYKDASAAFADCFESIGPFLGANADTRKRDLLLLRDQLNVTDEELATTLLQYFEPTNPKALDVRWNGVCLVGFDYASYPDIKKAGVEQIAQVGKALESWKSMISGRVTKHTLTEVNLDVFCIPFPDVDAFRSAIRKQLGIK